MLLINYNYKSCTSCGLFIQLLSSCCHNIMRAIKPIKTVARFAVTRIRTWVIAATTQGTNHYTITATTGLTDTEINCYIYALMNTCTALTVHNQHTWWNAPMIRLISHFLVSTSSTNILRTFATIFQYHIIFKGKVFYDQEPPSGESTTTECGFNYQLLAVIYWSSPMGSS